MGRKEQIKAKGKTKLMAKGGNSAGSVKQSIGGLSRKIEDSSANLEHLTENIKQYQEAYNEKLLQDQKLGQEISGLKNRMQELQQSYEDKVEKKKLCLKILCEIRKLQ